MAITFTSWTDCDWRGGFTLDWDAAIKRPDYLPYVEALRQALWERMRVSLGRWPGIIEGVPEWTQLLACGVESSDITLHAWGNMLQTTIVNMFPLFVNHLDSGGDWDQKAIIASVAPAWIYEDACNALDEDIIRVDQSSLISPAWFRQQRALLNLMRWTRHVLDNPTNAEYYYGHGEDASIEAAVDAAIAAIALFGAVVPETSAQVTSSYLVGDPPVTTGNVGMADVKWWAIDRQVGMSKSADLYLFTEAVPPEPGGTTVFYDNGLGFKADKFARVNALLNESDGLLWTKFGTSGPDSPPVYPTADNSEYGWRQGYDDGPIPPVVVCKWDVEGGLVFQ